MKEVRGNHFYFKYDPKDEEISQTIIKIAENTYDQVTEEYGIKADEAPFEFIICPDVASFIKYTGKTEETYQSWMVGNADYERRLLCILSPSASDRSLEDMLDIVRHEVVHIVFDSLSAKSPDDISPLIAEGIAVYLAQQVYPQCLNKSNRPDALKMCDEDYFFENDGYNYSGVYMGYFVRKYGMEAFKDIYAEKKPLEDYIYDGCEEDAIDSFLNPQH